MAIGSIFFKPDQMDLMMREIQNAIKKGNAFSARPNQGEIAPVMTPGEWVLSITYTPLAPVVPINPKVG